jgi:hypothetical protein
MYIWGFRAKALYGVHYLHHNLRPMRLMRLDWRENPILRERRSIKPPPVEKLPPVTEGEMRTTKLLTTNAPVDYDEELINPDEIVKHRNRS